jgi:nucleotide-binding universal stress UspA family protein
MGFLTAASHRIRIAHPRTRPSEELIHLLTGREAAQFFYYGGTQRNPEVAEQLVTAIDRYGDSDPVAVRHISAALGRAAARHHKRLAVKKGKQVITVLSADLERATDFLAKAVAPVTEAGRKASAFDPITEIRLVNQLAASQVKLGRESEATAVVTRTAKRLGQEGVPSVLVDDLKRPRAGKPKSR